MCSQILYKYIMNKKILALCISGLLLGACTSKPQKNIVTVDENSDKMFLFVGSYATPDEEGVKVYRFSEDTGKATYISGLKGISNPQRHLNQRKHRILRYGLLYLQFYRQH